MPAVVSRTPRAVVPLAGRHAKPRRAMGVREIIVAMTIAKSVRCTRRRVQVVETKLRYHSNHEMEGQCTVAIVSGLSVLTLAEIVDLAGSR